MMLPNAEKTFSQSEILVLNNSAQAPSAIVAQ